MPYIKMIDRDRLDYITDAASNVGILNAGELNYLITRLCITFMHDNGQSYQNINNVVGALEGAKMEFYRRYAAPYENTKIIENGDVYV
jgi:hypothetical protein